MNIKQISYILVTINLLFVAAEIPFIITAYIIGILILSLILKNKSLRTFVKVLALAGIMALVKFKFKPLLVPEAGVSFILALSALKLWELDSESDHFTMFLVLALVEGVLFLISPSLFMFICSFLKTGYFFYFMLKIRNYDLELLNFRRLLYLIIPGLLFSILLFYTFPRFTQGFAGGGPHSNPFYSGLNTRLDFNKLGPLNLSSKIVFHAYGLPFSTALYWRSSVLWGNHGNEWFVNPLSLKEAYEDIPEPKTNYQIRLSEGFNEFLPVLDGVSQISKITEEFLPYVDGSFRLKNFSRKEIRFSVSTHQAISTLPYSTKMFQRFFGITRDSKKDIMNTILGTKDIKNLNDEEKLNAITLYFKNMRYEYSLNPPTYTSIEEFIKKGKSGYCSHFASAFVYMARALDLPGRVVMGYQGGELNPFDNSIIVRERDGHAWAEIYLEKSGWKRIDPTSWVAPSRIALGANEFNSQINPNINLYYFQVPRSFFTFQFLTTAEMWFDSFNYKFNELLLNFDKERQLKMLQDLLPSSFSTGWAFVFSLSIPLVILFGIFSFLSKEKILAEEKRYKKFLKLMKNFGDEKRINETASAFANRCLSDKELPGKIINTIQMETEFYINSFYRSP